MRAWDTFYPYVLPEVLGCPEPTVDLKLIEAAREWCSSTRCWREDLDPVTMSAGNSYDFSFPTEADGVTLVGAALNDQPIGLDVPDSTSISERRQGTGGPRRVRTTDMVTFTVLPPAGAGQILRLEAVLQPTEDATGLPNAIADRYRAMIAKGALAALLQMNKVPWANPMLGATKRLEFERDIARIKSKVWRGHANNRPRNVGQFF